MKFVFLRSSLKTSAWLALRELLSLRARFVTSVALVTVAIALCVATELLSKAREIAVTAEIDNIGPSIQLIPSEVSQTDLAQLNLNGMLLQQGLKKDVKRRFSRWIRAVEGRFIRTEVVNEILMPVIEIDDADSAILSKLLKATRGHGGLLGAVAADRLGKKVGDTVFLGDTQFQITTILPTAGTAEDIALFISLDNAKRNPDLQSVNEIRVFLFPDSDIKYVGSLLRTSYKNVNTIINDRGSVADRESVEMLRKHRFVVYTITSMIVAISLLIGGYLNARERMDEMAILVAIGGTRFVVFNTLMMRAIIVSVLGSISGYLIGVGLAFLQDVGGVFLFTGSWDIFVLATLATTLLSLIAVGPVLLMVGARLHGQIR